MASWFGFGKKKEQQPSQAAISSISAPQQQQQQQYQAPPAQYSPALVGTQAGACSRLPTKNWSKDKPISSLIVTMCEGSSYDNIFREKVQEPPEDGLAVSLFQFNYSAIDGLMAIINSNGDYNQKGPVADVVRDFWSDYSRVNGPQYVVLNWECCTPALTGHYPVNYKQTVQKLTRLFIDKQHLVMFGDYAVMALIQDWDDSILGPNPFLHVGTGAGSSVLKFNVGDLYSCPSSQLVTVANLCERGSANISGTCQFAFKPELPKTEAWTLKLLTLMTGAGHSNCTHKCSLETYEGAHTGTAGHALLTYPSGGYLLLAGPHWIELSRLDVSLKSVMQYAQANESPEALQKLQDELSSAAPMEQMSKMQSYVQEKVWKASPAMSYKTKQ